MCQENCPYEKRCGACRIGQGTYEEGLAEKQRRVQKGIGK